ncbi:MAG: tRNA (adenosine(37)-N6)-dimethylallyltransferase MiaA [Peptoniphilaceae bacterium]|nr:tRNA (adenosine(37)-N6)-dimethylallyltransferase MiaA [Peptoniphilaceae bacterium]
MAKKVIFITGPTACGKTDVANLLSKKFNTNLISTDSQQIYIQMDIGTNKDLSIKQELVDIKYPNEDFSVEEYRKEALKIISNIDYPIFAGGSGFYIDSLIYNMNFAETSKDLNIRKKYENLYEKNGKKYLYDLLYKIDPKTALKYHINETNRIIRNLEIFEKTGKKPSEIKNGYKQINEKINPYIYLLNYKDRNKLYDKINKRVDEMIKIGLINEVDTLIKKYNLTEKSQSMRAIGYKETIEYLQNKITFDELLYNIKINTRHYAKRQITWMKRYRSFNNFKEIFVDDFEDKKSISNFILEDLKEKKFGI